MLASIYESVGEIKANLKTYHEEVRDIQVRLRGVELWKARIMGSFAFIGLPLTLLLSLFKRNHSA